MKKRNKPYWRCKLCMFKSACHIDKCNCTKYHIMNSIKYFCSDCIKYSDCLYLKNFSDCVFIPSNFVKKELKSC